MPLPFVSLASVPGPVEPAMRWPLDDAAGVTSFREIGGSGNKLPGALGGTLPNRGGGAPGTTGSVGFYASGYINVGSGYTNSWWHQYGISIAAWIYRTRDTVANDINPIFVLGPWAFVFMCGHHGSLPFSYYNTMWAGFVNSNGNWDGVLDNNGPLPLNTWVHVVATWDGNRLGIHRDSWDVASSSGITGPGSNTGGACIGVYPDGSSWRMNGFYLSDVRIYPYRLYDGDVSALYNSYFTPAAAVWTRGHEPQNLVCHIGLNRVNIRDLVGGLVTFIGGSANDPGAGVEPAPGMGATNFNGSTNCLLGRGYPAMALTVPWTLSCWAYPNATRATVGTSTCMITKRYTGNNIPYCLGYGNEFGNGNRFYVGIYRTSGGWAYVNDTVDATLNTWTHVAAVYDGVQLKLYRNGILVNFAAYSGTATLTDDQIVIGGRWDALGTTGAFPGNLSDARIYNQALSDADIKGIYDRAKGIQRPWMPLGTVT